MVNRRRMQTLCLGLVVALACLGLAACGGGGSSSSGSGGSTAEAEPSAAESSDGGANVSAARSMIAPYQKGPTPFPVDEPLKKKLAAGEHLSYLQCATPYCALLGELYGAAAEMVGTKLDIVKATESTESLQNGLSSIEAGDPAALLLAGVNLASLGGGLEGFTDKQIPVSVTAIMGGEAKGIDANVNGEEAVELAGELLANWAIVNGAPEGGVVWFEVPELDFSKYETEGFERAMEENCPECEVLVAKTPISSVGSTAPSIVVSELQAHPDVKVALFASFETATGLPAAMQSAGVEAKTAGYAPTPGNLQDIQSGALTATVGLDTAVVSFTQVDAAVRLATGQKLTKAEQESMPVIQLLEKKQLEGVDVTKGWNGYPDFAERFAKVWGVSG